MNKTNSARNPKPSKGGSKSKLNRLNSSSKTSPPATHLVRAIAASEAFDSTLDDSLEQTSLEQTSLEQASLEAVGSDRDGSGLNSGGSVNLDSPKRTQIPFRLAVCFANQLHAAAFALYQTSDATSGLQVPDEAVMKSFKRLQRLTGTGEASKQSLLSTLTAIGQRLNSGSLSVEHPNGADEWDGQAMLRIAIHHYLSAHCTHQQFDKAVETSSRRAVYELAYGLSHEINNPLANIAARAQQLLPSVSSESDRKSLATIVDQSMRAHEMLAEMMRVIQPRKASLRVENLVPILRDAVSSVAESWKHAKVQVETRFETDACFVSLDRSLLSEAIGSLIQNAFQVCRPSDRIEVACESQDSPNACVCIVIRDTGPGLSAESAKRAFDLYYSGREHGRGLGISLANVRQIVDSHGGKVWMESVANAGCRVEIQLPTQESPRESRRVPRV